MSSVPFWILHRCSQWNYLTTNFLKNEHLWYFSFHFDPVFSCAALNLPCWSFQILQIMFRSSCYTCFMAMQREERSLNWVLFYVFSIQSSLKPLRNFLCVVQQSASKEWRWFGYSLLSFLWYLQGELSKGTTVILEEQLDGIGLLYPTIRLGICLLLIWLDLIWFFWKIRTKLFCSSPFLNTEKCSDCSKSLCGTGLGPK